MRQAAEAAKAGLRNEKLKPEERYVAKFSKRPVGAAYDWANSPFRPEEQSFTRKYGGSEELSFMLTDVATGDCGNAVKGGHAEHPTTLQAVADVAQNYLQEWRDIRFTVDRLRAAYLNERLSEEVL